MFDSLSLFPIPYFLFPISRMKVSRTLILLLLVTALAACAGPSGIVPDKTTLAQVYASMGRPTDIRFDANGDELWEYATGPQGTDTYLVSASTDGQVKEVTQLLTEEQFDKIRPGQSDKLTVRNLLGRPSDELFYYNGTSWTWFVHVGPQDGNIVVHFRPDGVVLDKIIIIDVGSGDSEGDRGDAGQ